MQLADSNKPTTHLGYCTNIHAGEKWHDVFAQLQKHVPLIKRQVSPDAAFGLGLRASMQSITDLQDTSTFDQFAQWLRDENLYVFTVNGFPYGTFHGTQVKADVYRPDWSSEERLNYTCAIADLLARLRPPDNIGSISTVPGTFRDWANESTRVAITHNLLRCVAHCLSVQQDTGVTIKVALEPEPACLLETVDDVVSFFQNELHTPAAASQLAALAKCSEAQASEAIRTHLGVCYDICHAAVEFEDPVAGIQRMHSAGIPVIKLQLSSALKIPVVDNNALNALQSFDEPVYLHQVVERTRTKLTRFHDLPLAMQAHELASQDANGKLSDMPTNDETEDAIDDALNKEWRVHFHVPVFLNTLESFGTTQDELSQVLEAHAKTPLAAHLEVETYTWDVLPENYRNVTVDQAIARELGWVMQQLKLPNPRDAAA